MTPWVCRSLVYRPVYRLRGEPVFALRRQVRNFHALSRDEMQQAQWTKLAALLQFLERRNPYYRELFRRKGLSAGDIRTPDDFTRLPILTKETLNSWSGEMVSEGRFRVSSRKTSGSTGIPLKFVKDRLASAHIDAVMHEVYGWHGIEIGDRQARVWGVPLDLAGNVFTRLKDALLNRKRLVAFDLSPERAEQYYRILRRFSPKFMYGLVNTMCEFGRLLMQAAYNPADLGIEVMVTTGEILFDYQRRFLSETFGCRVVNEYGCTECGIIAFECTHGNMHLLENSLYVEVINPQSGKPAGPGETGEVIVTELHSYAMPYVRYRVGDLMQLKPGRCQCGIESPLIENVQGRVSDLIATPSGRQVSSAILSYSMPRGVSQFRTYQREVGALEVMVVSATKMQVKELGGIKNKLAHKLGSDMQVTVKQVETIPVEPSGKFRHFVSDLQPKKD